LNSNRARATSERIAPDACHACAKKLSGSQERALFVEEEVGRIFCSEACIAAYFTPEIERLEKEYFRRLAPTDLNATERDALGHLRWITLQEPDEIWREKTLSGDYRYTLISEFKPGSKKVWSICICLFLRGEPSFLYLALATRNMAMVNAYRRGERVEWATSKNEGSLETKEGEKLERHRGAQAEDAATSAVHSGEDPSPADGEPSPTDRLGDPWTADETLMARMNQERREDDIPPEEFAQYQSLIELTLESPDEVWSIRARGPEGPKLYHFIKQHAELAAGDAAGSLQAPLQAQSPGVWYVIIARELDDQDDQIEILDAFPTRDPYLVESYRQGEQEVGQENPTAVKIAPRVVH
jgi:hypothetical protein